MWSWIQNGSASSARPCAQRTWMRARWISEVKELTLLTNFPSSPWTTGLECNFRAIVGLDSKLVSLIEFGVGESATNLGTLLRKSTAGGLQAREGMGDRWAAKGEGVHA